MSADSERRVIFSVIRKTSSTDILPVGPAHEHEHKYDGFDWCHQIDQTLLNLNKKRISISQ